MQFVDGIELLDLLYVQSQVYSECQARKLFIQILKGIEFLHSK